MLAAATTVPLWATVLIGLVGGVLGALVGSISERSKERRTRMLDAANDFIVDTWRMTKVVPQPPSGSRTAGHPARNARKFTYG